MSPDQAAACLRFARHLYRTQLRRRPAPTTRTEHATSSRERPQPPVAAPSGRRFLTGMPVGGEGYIAPWGLWADVERRLWVHAHDEFKPAPGGTVTMRIARTADGFRVWSPEPFYPATPDQIVFPYAGGGLPVTDLIIVPESEVEFHTGGN